MPPFIRFSNPIRLEKLTHVMQIRGVDVRVHWTVFVVTAIILAGVARRPGLTILGLAAYFSVMLIHETGHLLLAQRKGCNVLEVDLYPIFGVTRFTTPWSRLDHCVIAWGGVLAQAVVFIPIVLWVHFFGYSHIEGVNMMFAILNFFSLGVSLLNLLPIRPLDGSIAWGIAPAFLAAKRARISRKPMYR
jgi:hypothetical protein